MVHDHRRTGSWIHSQHRLEPFQHLWITDPHSDDTSGRAGMDERPPSDVPDRGPKTIWQLLRLRLTVFALHLLQPLARLEGRLRGGLTPWRRRGTKTAIQFRASTLTMWRDERESLGITLENLQRKLPDAEPPV